MSTETEVEVSTPLRPAPPKPHATTRQRQEFNEAFTQWMQAEQRRLEEQERELAERTRASINQFCKFLAGGVITYGILTIIEKICTAISTNPL